MPEQDGSVSPSARRDLGVGGLIARMLAFVGVAAVAGATHAALVDPVRTSWRDAAPTPGTAETVSRTASDADTVSAVAPDSGSAEMGRAADTTAENAVDTAAESGMDPSTFGIDLTFEQTRWLFENDMATFVDARAFEEYEEGHIEGAMWMPAYAFDDGEPVNFLMIDLEKPIVIYCGGGDCDASENTAIRIQGYAPSAVMHVFKDGYPAWVDAGLPIGTGPDPILEEFGVFGSGGEGEEP